MVYFAGLDHSHATRTSAIRRRCHQPKVHLIMKSILLTTLALSTLLVVSCNKQKAAIDARTDTKQTAIDHEKEAVTAAAKEATAQTDANAAIDKANIEANKVSAQAQLDAEKTKNDAAAAAEKARVDAEKK
jgi:hypothetical protein